MTLASTLLERLADWQPAPGRQTLFVDDPSTGSSVTVEADRSDVLGCLVWELTVRRTENAARSLQDWASHAERVTGLLEPLKVIEIDETKNEGFLRTATPTARKGKVLYYELFLHGPNAAVLRRFAGAVQTNDKREQVAFPLTHEAIVRIVGDLTA